MIRNTAETWGWPARTFHWVIAAMIVGQVSLGIWMDEGVSRADKPFYESVHASVGITILALILLRLIWRMMNVAPAPPAGTPLWQRKAAHGVHWALYLVTFATVLAGWLMVGTQNEPVAIWLFGVIEMPQLLSPGSPLHEFLEEAHGALAFTLVALVIVHIAAALYHMLVLRDDVMRRMVGGASSR